MRKVLNLVLVSVLALSVVVACAPTQPPQVAAGGVTQVTEIEKVQKNSQGHTVEQQNIIDRIKVTTDPTKVMWIHLISLDGKIIQRMAVAHKVTSSGKRLEPIQAASTPQYGYSYPTYSIEGRTYQTSEFLQSDGTFGSSDAYIFWFDPLHRYHQWGTAGGLGYMLTDYPIDLVNPKDEVTGMFNADKAASEWQQRQEAQLRLKEGK